MGKEGTDTFATLGGAYRFPARGESAARKREQGAAESARLRSSQAESARLETVFRATLERIDHFGPIAAPDSFDDALRRMGVPRRDVVENLRAALQGVEAGIRYDGPQKVERVIRFPNDGRVGPGSLERLPIVRDDGVVVELGQLVRFEEGDTPSMIRREAGQRRVEDAAASAALPKRTAIRLGVQIEQARETQRRLSLAVVIVLVLVVALLFVALRRWREALIVLTTLPNAFVGGIITLWLTGETWNISSIVGMVGLFGVAVQNSLVLIRQAEGLRLTGSPFLESVREASLGRVRPKLMTAGSAILGLSPMLFGIAGSELERPLAIVMVGGLMTSTLYTLLALPSVYAWIGGRRHE